MNKKFILIATLAMSFSFYGCKNDTPAEDATEDRIEMEEEIVKDSLEKVIDSLETDKDEVVKEIKKEAKKKVQTKEEKTAAEIKKAEEKILDKGIRGGKKGEIIVDEEKLKKEAEIKKAEEKLLEKGPRSTTKGVQ